jgi:hypothetical protein
VEQIGQGEAEEWPGERTARACKGPEVGLKVAGHAVRRARGGENICQGPGAGLRGRGDEWLESEEGDEAPLWDSWQSCCASPSQCVLKGRGGSSSFP